MQRKRIVIVGGGFGGVQCARTLARKLRSGHDEIVLFDRQNHLVFSPLLAEVVGSSINPMDVVVPLRQLLPHVFCRTETVTGVDLDGNRVKYDAEDGHPAQIEFDQLVLACGSQTNLNVVPGMADHAFALKTVADAARLRSHLVSQMELAEVAASPQRSRLHLTVLVVGGGFSGVEAAGEINDLLRTSARYYRRWTAYEVRVVLIHGGEQILPEISPGLRDFALRKMQEAGVEFVLSARAAAASATGVKLENGHFVKGDTIVCTVGNSPLPIVEALNVPKQKGRLVTEPDLRLQGRKNVWAIGDCAWITNSHDGRPAPTTGQFAEREGRQCGLNILRVLGGEPTRAFRFKPLGELCSIGGHSAVADLLGWHLSGFLAWFVWRGVYLFKLPSLGRRLQVGFDWAFLLVFPRDLAYVRPEETERVSHAHYGAGEFIFQEGEAPTNFYVLEKGEVEVVRGHNGTDGDVVAVLGAGSFFGERALLTNRPRVMSVRARTPVEVLVMGKNVFAQVSGALAPLRDALAQTLNRRMVDLWKDRPLVYDLLHRTRVGELMEPLPQPWLHPRATLREIAEAFVKHNQEFFYVSSDGRTLEGVITITDLLRSKGGAASGGEFAAEMMTRNPVTVSSDDPCTVAAGAFREYRLKSLPVVEGRNSRVLVGCLRVRRLLAYVLKELPQAADEIRNR
jgi:NADH:ubiquinone reductase (H+-translocating)